MVKLQMFQQIQLMKKRGFSKSKISRELSLDRGTVAKYFKMTDEQFQIYRSSMEKRFKEFDYLEEEILKIYNANRFRSLPVSSVYDLLEEKFGALPATEKSLRNFIQYLIQTGKLVLDKEVRVFQKVPQLEYGRQMQTDFGQYRLPSGLKLYIYSSILSASRYRYAAFQDRPFTAKDVIKHLLDTFEYFGGMPSEVVIDQDATLVVSENCGDITYTKDFSTFIDEMKLKIYVCRKADPQSKGKIENTIKYIKNNFLTPRDFNDVQIANEGLWAWLARRANGKLSRATNRIPAEMFEEEKAHFRPVRNSVFYADNPLNKERRKVSDQSFILFSGNEYSVPQKFRNRQVDVYETENRIFIYDPNDGSQVAEHVKTADKGQKIIIRGHFRHREKSSERLFQEVSDMFDSKLWHEFLAENKNKYPRYARDQLSDAKKYFDKNTNQERLLEALKYCLTNKTLSFKNLKDSYDYFHRIGCYGSEVNTIPDIKINLLLKDYDKPDVETRDASFYKQFLQSGGES